MADPNTPPKPFEPKMPTEEAFAPLMQHQEMKGMAEKLVELSQLIDKKTGQLERLFSDSAILYAEIKELRQLRTDLSVKFESAAETAGTPVWVL